MQVQIKDIEEKKEKAFHPFVLEFKIESEENLLELLARFNMTQYMINEELSEMGYRIINNIKHDVDVWIYLNNLYKTKPYMK